MNQFKKSVQLKSNLYNEYTIILNSLLGLTNKQVLVLSRLFELNDTTPITKSLLNRDNRLDIIDICNIDECNLSTYFKLFKTKGIIIKESGKYKLYEGIKPLIHDNHIEMIFKINIENGNNNTKT